MPGFITNIDQVRAKGYEVVACVSVNDAFVTDAWGKSVNAEGSFISLIQNNLRLGNVFKFLKGKVRMLADPSAVFTKVGCRYKC